MNPDAPKGSHLAYWRKSPKPATHTSPMVPLEPLTTRQAVGLIVVATLIAALVMLSILWWIRAVHH